MSNKQDKHTPGTWELDFIESALNAYWHDATNNLGRKDLGDLEKKNYVYQLAKSKELMRQIDKREFYLQAENEQLKKLLESLTPGGSEFYNDPERCAAFIREQLAAPPKIIAGLKKQVEVLRDGLKYALEVIKDFDPKGDKHIQTLIEQTKPVS